MHVNFLPQEDCKGRKHWCFREITVHREVRISWCVCDKLTISLSEDEIELDRIVQRAVVNETALTTSLYQLPDQ